MNGDRQLPVMRGRGTARNPASRFVPLEFEPEAGEEVDHPPKRTRFFRDDTKGAIVRNDSPDVGFDFSINPYRGCEHGCIYCYARPTHEYFGLSAGLDFESTIFVKERLPELLRAELASPKWRPATIAISGVTDPYQPVERRLELTRRCLRVLADFGNPVSVITKNHLVARDADLFAAMAAASAARVSVSVTTLDPGLQRIMEPRTSSPALRLSAIRILARAGVPVTVMVAPIIPGLNDHEMPAILEAAASAGATSAGFITLRLPHGVAALFEDWLDAHMPDRKGKILGRVRSMRGGRLNDPRFGVRMRGEGEYADQIRALFAASCAKYGLDRRPGPLSIEAWRGPAPDATRAERAGQLRLL